MSDGSNFSRLLPTVADSVAARVSRCDETRRCELAITHDEVVVRRTSVFHGNFRWYCHWKFLGIPAKCHDVSTIQLIILSCYLSTCRPIMPLILNSEKLLWKFHNSVIGCVENFVKFYYFFAENFIPHFWLWWRTKIALASSNEGEHIKSIACAGEPRIGLQVTTGRTCWLQWWARINWKITNSSTPTRFLLGLFVLLSKIQTSPQIIFV